MPYITDKIRHKFFLTSTGAMTMKTENQNIFKEFLRKEIIRNAKEQNLTDEQVTEMLDISVRTYYYIKSGKNNCSSTTLFMYLIRICHDMNNFFNRAKSIIL